MQTSPLSCASCGAPLDPPNGRSIVECSYCGQTLQIQGKGTAVMDGTEGKSLVHELLRGYQRDFGEGERHGAAEMTARDWRALERGVWPVDGRASSTYGSKWAPTSVVGPPRVYPSSGDRAGAWAPRARISAIEWIEASFPDYTPAVEVVRVFETNVSGATFAVTARERVGDEEVLLWQGPPEPRQYGEARVLEVRVHPPRSLYAVRAYVVNDAGAYTEIDTIGLVAVDPLPESARAVWPKINRSRAAWVAVAVALLAVGVALAIAHGNHPSRHAIAAPATALSGATAEPWRVDRAGLEEVHPVWATGATASTEFAHDRWSAARATGAPNVFPRHADDGQAWATKGRDDGGEWLEVGWDEPVTCRGIAVVETFNPGALVRIDDLSNAKPVTLWKGALGPSSRSRVVRVTLPEPRAISKLRLVLDTARVSGWNEIDAVGLLTSR